MYHSTLGSRVIPKKKKGGVQVAAASARKVEEAGDARRIRVDQRALHFVVVVLQLS